MQRLMWEEMYVFNLMTIMIESKHVAQNKDTSSQLLNKMWRNGVSAITNWSRFCKVRPIGWDLTLNTKGMLLYYRTEIFLILWNPNVPLGRALSHIFP
jgi:hypothetical protein